MRRFRYWTDPLFVSGCIAYAVNRWLVKPVLPTGFFHSSFNDLLLIPCALPPLLWLERKLGVRRQDSPPDWREILFLLIFWSFLFEWIGPKIVAHATGDFGDVIAYFAGGIVAWAWWRWHYSRVPARL